MAQKPTAMKEPTKLRWNVKNEKERRPLARVNKVQMTDEDRQEKRKQLFKQGKQNTVTAIKGVRTNRRFELMMQNRKKQ